MVVCDVRFENEADLIRSLGGVVIKVERPGYQVLTDDQTKNHASELNIDLIHPDQIVLNDGSLSQLATKVHEQITPAIEPLRTHNLKKLNRKPTKVHF
jgi:hypothetical protein